MTTRLDDCLATSACRPAGAEFIELKHGYTVADLDRIAHVATAADRLMATPAQQRYDLAWSAIAEHRVATAPPPGHDELVQVGCQAIASEVHDHLRHHGYHDDDRATGSQPSHRFLQLWPTRNTPSHEDTIVDELAARQLFRLMTVPGRRAVSALHTHTTHAAAAQSLNVPVSTLG